MADDAATAALRASAKRFRLHREQELHATRSGRLQATGRWHTREPDMSSVLGVGTAWGTGPSVLVDTPPGWPSQCRIHALCEHPGAFHVSDALGEAERATWAASLLSDWCEGARTNLSAEEESAGLWRAAARGDEWDSAAGRWAQGGGGEPACHRLRRRRWATLGAVYDWTARAYDARDAAAPPVPPAVCAAASRLARHLADTPLRGDAALVNFYATGDGLGPHRDDAESGGGGALRRPIVAFSLGCPAIFILGGGGDGCAVATPMLLRSGDALILSGSARAAPHAMPRVLSPGDGAEPAEAAAAAFAALRAARPAGEAAMVAAWLAHTRVSISVRDFEQESSSGE